jgi:hypothetical protein
MHSFGRLASVCALFTLAGCLDTPIKRITQDSSIQRPDGGSDAGPDADVPQPCDTDEQCTDKRASRCGPDHLCIPCGDNLDCGKFPDAHACIPEVGCFECDTGETSACTGDTKVCDLASHACVECTALNHVACTGDTDYCHIQTGTCVQCLTNVECTAPGASVCNELKECESCTDDNGCAHMANNATHCNTGKNQCVQCFENAHCPLDSPVCDMDTGTCRQCEHSTECGQRDGTTVCFEGGCVECTADEREACKTEDNQETVCDVAAHSCANDRPVESANVCEDCVSDAECKVGQACVLMQWDTDENGTPDVDVGRFCQWIKNGGGDAPMACVSTARPYTGEKTVARTDKPEEMVTICTLAASTCPAHSVFRNPCGRFGQGPTSIVVESRFDDLIPGSPVSADMIVPDDSLCGLGGNCVAKSAADGAYQCSVACGNSNGDCPVGPFTCGGDPPGIPSICSI